MWHTGTLDPLATGLLLIATENDTKLISYLEKSTKEYVVKIGLDGISPSYDIDTEVDYISEEKKKYYEKNMKINQIQSIIDENFSWEITQVPPKYSALKQWWKKAIDRVRAGEEVIMKERSATILDSEILSFSYPDLECRFKVSAGTYIRSIASDIWELLWTGGYVKVLRRSKINDLLLKYAQSLDDFNSENSLDESLLFKKKYLITLNEKDIQELNFWRIVEIEGEYEEWWAYFVVKDGKITYVVRYSEWRLCPKRIIVT